MTTTDVLMLRESAGFVSPIRPLERGDRWVMFAGRGVYEFGLHVDDAFEALVHGMLVGGRVLPCSLVDALPMLGGLQVRCVDPDRPTGFVEASAA